MDDCLYEQIDDKPVQEQEEKTPIVGGSPAYETISSFTATGMTIHLSFIIDYIFNLIFLLFTSLESIAHQELDETPQIH